MKSVFPAMIQSLPRADIPFEGVTAYLSQGEGHQIVFMEFDRDMDVPAHTHASQWGVALAGRVDPSTSEISVAFSKDMKVTGHCWSWCSVQEGSFPVLAGDTEYLDDNRTCVLHVVLEPEKTYAIWINVDQFQSFQDTAGHPAVPYLLVFRTGSD